MTTTEGIHLLETVITQKIQLEDDLLKNKAPSDAELEEIQEFLHCFASIINSDIRVLNSIRKMLLEEQKMH